MFWPEKRQFVITVEKQKKNKVLVEVTIHMEYKKVK